MSASLPWCAFIYSRHMGTGLGWEWHGTDCLTTKEAARESADRHIRSSIQNSVFPRSRSNYKRFVFREETDESQELRRVLLLRRLNDPYMAERDKWPSLVGDCSDEYIEACKQAVEATTSVQEGGAPS